MGAPFRDLLGQGHDNGACELLDPQGAGGGQNVSVEVLLDLRLRLLSVTAPFVM